MFTAEYFVSKLAAHKRLIQAGATLFVAGQTAQSFYVVGKLAQERIKEIEDEDRAEMVATTASMFKHVASRCQAKDKDFWPSAVSRRVGHNATGLDSQAQSSLPVFNILEELLRPAPTSEADDSAIQTQQDPFDAMINEDPATMDHSQPSAAVMEAMLPRSPPVVYITLDFVARHTFQTLLQTVHMMASTVEETPLHTAVVEHKRRVIEKVDAAREACRGAIRWPQMELRRRSALRYRIEWHGMTFPVHSMWCRGGGTHNGRVEHDLTNTL